LKVQEINSSQNAVIKRIRSLDNRAARKECGLFLLEGKKLIEEAQANKIDLIDIVTTREFLEEELTDQLPLANLDHVSVVSDQLFKTLYTTTTSCGIVASAVQPTAHLSPLLEKENVLLVIGEEVQDPGNLGTIVRNCLAFGVDALILSKGSVDCYSPKVVRSAMGALFALPVVQEVDLEDCLKEIRKKRIAPLALDANGQTLYWQANFSTSVALIFGNEGRGLCQATLDGADSVLSIPIAQKCESLNIGVSVGIILAHIDREKRM
jgi:RNA methyltransferase, TrmH family